MLISRGISALRAFKRLSPATFQQAVRNSGGWHYRSAPEPPPRSFVLTAELINGFAWWWILWHLWTEPGHILGEFEYPDRRKFTDEELGIPEDMEIE